MQLGKVSSFIKKHCLLVQGDTIVVAVSGGPDSLCLLHLLYRMRDELDLKLVVAHLNHGLRPEAAREAQGVKKLSESLAVKFETKKVDVKRLKKEFGISEEEAGRKARYELFFEVARRYEASVIALGHHLDDQSETVLLNIIRGTGVDGLAGMLPLRIRKKVKLIRPLLCLRRAEIEAYCRDHGLQPFTDSSNLETDYTRNKLRLELIPRLEEDYNPRIREALFNLAALAAEDRRMLRNLALKKYLQLSRSRTGKTYIARQALLGLPGALQGRVLHYALKKFVSAKKISRVHIGRLLDLARSGSTGSVLSLPGAVEAYCSYNLLVLAALPRRERTKFRPVKLAVPGKTLLPGGAAITARLAETEGLSWPPHSNQAYLDFHKIPGDALEVRTRWPGARFYPQGSGGSKKLKDFLIDQKIPAGRRDNLPLVTEGSEIIWVAGVRIAEPYRLTGDSKKALVLEYSTAGRRGKQNKPSKGGK